MTSTKLIDYDINKPDNLLADVKMTVNKATKHLTSKATEKDAGIDYGLLEPHLNGVRTIRTETSATDKSSSRSVLGSPSLVRKVMNESKKRGQSPTPKEREIEFENFDQSPKLTRDVKFELDPLLHSTPNGTTTRMYNYSKTTSSTHNATPYKTQIVEMDTTDLPAELKNAPISSDLLPQPGTKITETVKTYSYQIPDDKKVPENVTFKNEYYNSKKTSNTYYPENVTPPESKKIYYTSETRTSSNHITPPIVETVKPYQTKYYYKKEVNETKNNIYAQPPPPPPKNDTITWYERNETNENNVFHPPNNITSYTQNVSQNDSFPPGTKQTYLYKKETTNTTNTVYEPPPPPPALKTEKYYKYSSTTTTRNTHNGSERETVGPFPTEGIQSTQVDGPPKNLNQLMSTFEEETVNVDDEPYVPRKEVNTALATNKNPPSKNVAGPPVYYPPGKELFIKSEAQGALKARGATGKGSGKYEYEAESKSKNASKSGAAVVPVCLPLCCAMPCSIM